MGANRVFYYFGDDEAYLKTLQGEFRHNSRLSIEFKKFFATTEEEIQSLFIQVYKFKPACVFIDFSKNTQDFLHLARLLVRTPMEYAPLTVGLVDYLSPPEIMSESMATGVNLTHIKSAESFDVVFDVAKLLAPNEMGEHGFANAKLDEDVEAGIPLKVGYIHNEGLHFETDYKLTKGDRIRLNHHWLQKKMVPSKVLTVSQISTTNLFYHFKYAVDADFMFVDEFLPPEGMDPKEIKERQAEREDMIYIHRKQLARWIDDNQTRSLEKKAKVLVVDRDFHFYDNQQRTDKHNYTIRCVPYIQDIGSELDRLQPQVIAYALDDEDQDDPKNTMAHFERLVEATKKKFSDISPFFILFNSQVESKSIQNKLEYAHIMSISNELSVDLLVKMAEIFDKKLSKELSIQVTKKPQNRVFIKKNNPASVSELLLPVKIVKLSETDMIFQSEQDIPIGTNLHFTTPVNMYVQVQPTKSENSKVPLYYGLIHAMGEHDKQELRKYVNSVFFREHDAQVSAEMDEFKKLNESKLQEKIEQEKRLAEEAAKETQEESSDAVPQEPQNTQNKESEGV